MFRLACDQLVQVDHPKDWSIENERLEFLRRLEPSISNWTGQPPNLLHVFRAEEIECLLSDCVKNIFEGGSCYRAFVEFVVRSGYEDVSQLVDQDGKPQLRRTTPIHRAAKRSQHVDLAAVVRELFQVYKCDANYVDETGLTHFHAAVQFGCDDVVEKFLELGQDPNLAVPETLDSPLHLAMIHHRKKIAEMLLRSGARPNSPNAKRQTPLQILFTGQCDDADFVKTMLELSNGEYTERVAGLLARAVYHGLANVTKLLLRKCAEPDVNSALPERFYERWTRALRFFKKFHDDDLSELISEMLEERQREALRGAVRDGDGKKVESLLRRGVNPNSADKHGQTALHIVCKKRDDSVEAFFEICDAIGRKVSLDARDKWGYTALHWVAQTGRKKTVELLLRRGANPDLARKREGSTLLHDICSRYACFGFSVETLFEIVDERTQRRRVRVDARDRKGNTPLHLALRHSNARMVAVLLKNGADPNLTDAEGSTALHLLCKNNYCLFYFSVEQFFEICDDNRQLLQIDAKDNLGRTPLQWAVANVKPRAIRALLDRGAEIARFVFPTEDYYGAGFDPIDCWFFLKLKKASDALLAMEFLESGGYEPDRSDVLIVMKFFAKHRFFEKSPAVEKLLNDEEFVKFAKGTTIKADLSVYDLILMRPEEAETLRLLLLNSDHERKFRCFPEKYSQACHVYLFEKMSRRFFRNWALVCFMELINYRLPLESCEIIIDESFTNEDLCNICLATAIES